MPWTCTLVNVTKDGYQALAHLEFTDGETIIPEAAPSGDWTPASLKDYVLRRLAHLNGSDAGAAAIAGLIGQSISGEAMAPSSLEAARIANSRAMVLRQMHSTYTDQAVKTKIQERITAVESALKSFMAANPSVNLEDLI